jgi:predicted Rdx family selenoprotein
MTTGSGITTASAPYCHKCAWDKRGAWVATSKWPVIGVEGVPYLQLCEVCSTLAHHDAGFRVSCLVQVIERSMGASNGL